MMEISTDSDSLGVSELVSAVLKRKNKKQLQLYTPAADSVINLINETSFFFNMLRQVH